MTVFLTWLLVLTLTCDLTLISHQSLGMALISAPPPILVSLPDRREHRLTLSSGP
jgi:hypothetical protein